jgi:hypothetical protein
MKRKTLFSIGGALLVLAFPLTACGPSQDQLDQAVNATLTAMPPLPTQTPAATPTPTQIVPTATTEPSATPTPAVFPVPPGDPAALFGKPDALDTFDNDNNWTTYPPGDTPCFSSEIEDGLLWMTALGQQGLSCWGLSWPKLGNFYIDLTIKMPETCDPDDRFGLLFRAPDNNAGYLYGITCGGVQSFTAWTGTETLQILPAAKSEAIITTPGALNRVGIMAQDASFAFYINGQLVVEGLDQTFMNEGKIGLYVNSATTESFTVGYDTLAVWTLPRP